MSTASRRGAPALRLLSALVALIALGLAPVALAQETPAPISEEDRAQLLRGEQVFTANCAGCHQAGGIGIEGQFPPLIDNPNVLDAAYVEDVIRNGRQGELVVNGVTYNGVMPAFSTLPDEDIAAVVAYIQAGFVVPGGGGQEGEGDALPVAGTTLPNLAVLATTAAFGIAAVGIGIVMAPRVVSAQDRRTMPWLDAWLKTGLIVVGLVVALVFVPSWVLEWEPVTRLPRWFSDILASGIWTGALVISLAALWWFHREERI